MDNFTKKIYIDNTRKRSILMPAHFVSFAVPDLCNITLLVQISQTQGTPERRRNMLSFPSCQISTNRFLYKDVFYSNLSFFVRDTPHPPNSQTVNKTSKQNKSQIKMWPFVQQNNDISSNDIPKSSSLWVNKIKIKL